jgi:hypothetical protein
MLARSHEEGHKTVTFITCLVVLERETSEVAWRA